MRENKLRRLWTSGGAAVNGWLAIPNGFAAETMAHQGWDSLTIDLQHGVVDYQAAVNMLTAISTTATVPVVRVPWLDPGIEVAASSPVFFAAAWSAAEATVVEASNTPAATKTWERRIAVYLITSRDSWPTRHRESPSGC